jgi:hypothetical protein
MKEYKVESLIYYSKLTLDSKHIANDSKKKFSNYFDKYASKKDTDELHQHQQILVSKHLYSFCILERCLI